MSDQTQIEGLRAAILDIMAQMEEGFGKLTDLLTQIRGVHPLDPKNENTDALVWGLEPDEKIFLKEMTRSFVAADLVRLIWLGDSKATGVGSGYMRKYRDDILALRAAGGEVKTVLDWLARMATALEHLERAERARRDRNDGKTGR